MSMVRDHLWYWGLQFREGRCPTEPLEFFGLSNALVIVARDKPEPPFQPLMRQLTSVKRVVWSVLGESLSTRNDLEPVLDLAAEFPNLVAGIMDDFFTTRSQDPARVGRLTVEEVEHIRDRLHTAAHPLELWTVLYAHQLDLPVQPYLAPCDVVTFWTWWAKHLPQLEANFARFERVAPGKRRMLGCYLWDWGDNRPMPLELMQHQCQLGLHLLLSGRIEGLILLPGPGPLSELETAQWTRRWIAEVGDQEVPSPA